MQKFRFLLPLLILTGIVAVISLSIRSYSVNRNGSQDNPSQTVSEIEDGQSESSEPSVAGSEENEGIFSKIIGIVRPKPTLTLNTSGTGGANVTPSPAPLDTQFESSQVAVSVDEEKTVSILLPNSTERPNGYTFNISFDPKVLTVLKIEPGDTWDRTNVLRKSIDPVAGKASISAGQALGTENSSTGTKLTTLVVKAKSTTSVQSQLVIEPSSEFAYAGLDYGVPLKSQSIQVSVE